MTAPVTPLDLPRGPATLLVFGGTFDPVTRAHVELPVAVCRRLRADRLIYVPARRSPHKSQGAQASDEDRVRMLSLATAGHDRVRVWTDELDRAPAAGDDASYMVDTIGRLRSIAPRASMRLLIGADQVVAFHKWHRWDDLARLAPPAVMLRSPAEDERVLIDCLRGLGVWSEADVRAWSRAIVCVPTADVSATRARELLTSGAGDAALSGLLDAGVLAYIRERGLYH